MRVISFVSFFHILLDRHVLFLVVGILKNEYNTTPKA